MKNIFLLCFITVLAFLMIAADGEPSGFSWQDVFKTLVLLAVAVTGAPITQFFKNVFKLQDKMALLMTGLVAAAIAILEMWLAGLLDFNAITVQSFPATFFAVFSVATIYYALLKGSDSFLGRRTLLKENNLKE